MAGRGSEHITSSNLPVVRSTRSGAGWIGSTHNFFSDSTVRRFDAVKNRARRRSHRYFRSPDRHAATLPGVRCSMKRISASLRPLGAVLLTVFLLQGCKSLNPLCGSARPSPSIATLSADTITLAQVQQGFLLTVNGSHLVASSVVVINGTTLATQVLSSQQVQVTITSAVISAPGAANVSVTTPGGNSSDLGCTSGGTSQTLVLTVT
jgi:hypothetical protein